MAEKEKSPFLLDYTRARIDLSNFRVLLRARRLNKGAKFLEMSLAQGGTVKKSELVKFAHESPETTRIYMHADMEIKERALARTAPLGIKPARYRPDDRLLAFLEGL